MSDAAFDEALFTLTATAYNLVRLPKLVGAVARPCPQSAPTGQKPAEP